VEWRELHDGDEILIGRFRIYFLRVSEAAEEGRTSTVGSAVA
jgi:hypothetical protein